MNKIVIGFLVAHVALGCWQCIGQTTPTLNDERLLEKVLMDPEPQEIVEILAELKTKDLSPKNVVVRDSMLLANSNQLHIVSHNVEGRLHYGAVIIPAQSDGKKLPVIIFATGGDGMNKDFDLSQDFNHPAIQYPNFLGEELDQKFIVVIPSFRGQRLIIGDRKYQSEGNVNDAFDGATSDALALLNVTLKTFPQSDASRVAIYGGSRGGTVALLASARDKRIQRTIVVAAPTDMKALYRLYPEQFKLLFFNELLAGKMTESEARKKFLSISPIHFIHELPLVQLHHDQQDPFVPVEFAKKLTDKFAANGKVMDSFYYEEGIHGFWTDKNYWNRVQSFIRPLTE